MKELDLNLLLQNLFGIIGFGYIFFYMFFGRNNNPLTYRYQKVLNNKSFLKKHFIFCSILTIIGIIRYSNHLSLERLIFSPLIFLILLLLSNSIIKKVYQRNILIETKGKFSASPRVNKKATFLDTFLGILILLVSLISPLIIK